MKLQESGENYLENILILKNRLGRVRSVDLAAEMNFSKPSISRAVHLLEDEKYIVIQNDGTIELTEVGHDIAKKIYERHLFLTQYLMALGVDEKTAAEDACRMEHAISDQSFEALKTQMNGCEPGFCPQTSETEMFESTKRVLGTKTAN